LNSITKVSPHPIIKREARNSKGLSPEFEEIYYKRHHDPSNFDAYQNMIEEFKCDSANNQAGVDFDIYSTLEDA